MTLSDMYETFQSLLTNQERVEFLEMIRSMNLPYDINYENLIRIWSE
jgi:hypothetical protein